MHQGDPVPAEGGLFKRAWFDDHQISTTPLRLRTIVAVDPADSGHGDESGIVVLGLDPDGVVYLLADHSGQMTSDQSARRAVEAARTHKATAIVVEGYATGTTYQRILSDASIALRWPVRVKMWRGRGDALQRAAGLRNAAEIGRFRIVGELTTFEAAATTWLSGKHQPDRVAAAVVGFDHLAGRRGGLGSIAIPSSAPITGRPSPMSPNRWQASTVGPDRAAIEAASDPRQAAGYLSAGGFGTSVR
ncbi:phage terminase large subunit family protein [Lolliginicoccus suaedae]|uniref:phage terminase large subunit family protein n=1 Tax=Lolliginicoccus suaedae TaxID=2605429 RepID=UPI0011EEFEB6|nr:hypothetical protein [Lolliginicoccus suaedae]